MDIITSAQYRLEIPTAEWRYPLKKPSRLPAWLKGYVKGGSLT